MDTFALFYFKYMLFSVLGTIVFSLVIFFLVWTEDSIGFHRLFNLILEL